jgi:GNAT superfamily N-acetyltransferase
MNQVTIRPGEKRDLSQVTDLWLDLVRHHVELDGRIPDVVDGGAEKWQTRLEKSLDNPTCQLYIAEESGERRVVGFATGFLRYSADVFENQVAGKIADVFVTPDWRRQGVAKRLICALTRWFRDQSASHIEMNLVTSNPEAVGFWQEMGAREYMMQMWLPLDWQEKFHKMRIEND